MTAAPDLFSESFRPKLRWPFDVQYQEHRGERYAIFSDPLGVTPEPVVVPAALIPLLARFDGQRTVKAICDEAQPFGVTEELLQKILLELDQCYLLETSGSKARLASIRSEYRQLSLRQASHAGTVYPAEPGELTQELDRYLSTNSVVLTDRSKIGSSDRELVGFISPHIDYRRGWQTYGAGFAIIARHHRPDVIILLGTSHQPGEGFFHLTDKSFESPFGIIPIAREVVADIADHYGHERSYRDELLHRREHSLELQIPFLGYCFRDSGPPEIVPILVGSFHEQVLSNTEPSSVGAISDFIGILSDSIKKLELSGKRVLLHGGIDLTHMGRSFGDSGQLTDLARIEIERRDRELLEAVLAGDGTSLFAHIAEDNDRRRICGFPTLYVMLSSMNQAGLRPRGELVEYRQAYDSSTDCLVSFASAVWKRG